MRTRYYSPDLSRFVNSDVVIGEVSNAITLNRYAYANGNPVSNIDPVGLSADERGTGYSMSSSSYERKLFQDEQKMQKQLSKFSAYSPQYKEKSFIQKLWNEVKGRTVYVSSQTWRIFTSPIKALNVEAGLGIGMGASVKTATDGLDVSLSAEKSYTYSLVYEDWGYDIVHRDSEAISVNVSGHEMGRAHGKKHSCLMKDVLVKRTLPFMKVQTALLVKNIQRLAEQSVCQ